jgi:hypothetical protein
MRTKSEYAYILPWAKKVKAIELLGGKCSNCDEHRIWVLEFHHKDPKEKDFQISHIRGSRWSILEKEIKKCILLCRNCHQEIHKKEDCKYPSKKYKLLEVKNIFKCEKCSYDRYDGALDFHHKNPNDKKFTLNGIKIAETSCLEVKKKITDEINKCDILCSNCHIDLHFDKDKFEKYKEEIYHWNYKEKPKEIDKDLVIKMYNEGKRQVDIRKELNCAKSTISIILSKGR